MRVCYYWRLSEREIKGDLYGVVNIRPDKHINKINILKIADEISNNSFAKRNIFVDKIF